MKAVIDEYLILIIVAGAAVFLPLAFKLVSSVKRFHASTQRIRNEYNHSYDKEDCEFWRREMRCHYLRLLPFVTRNNVMKIHNFFYRDK